MPHSVATLKEFASGDGSEERDSLRDSFASRTPLSRSETGVVTKPGKFWVYERVMRVPYYGIYQISNDTLGMYQLVGTEYEPMTLNQRGHYPIKPMQVELGVWQGVVLNQPEQCWLRWWDQQGNLLLTGQEQAQQEKLEKEEALQQLEQERQKRQQLAQQLQSLTPEQLQSLGIDPEMLR